MLSDLFSGFVNPLHRRMRRTWERQPAVSAAGAVFIVVALIAVSAGIYRQPFAAAKNAAILAALWQSYKTTSWDSASGRTIDRQDGNVTTSEGQAYTMLRAVWSNDRSVFDTTWHWTAGNLQRSDYLFSWRYGALPGGGQGIQTAQGGVNTASDADTDIAFALLMAGGRWHDQAYVNAARPIIHAVWQKEVVMIRGRPYVAADDIEKTSVLPAIVTNPSYVAPYAYRVFAVIDKTHNWPALASNAYAFIQAASRSPLGTASDGLPPDWVRINRQNGELLPPAGAGETTDFGFDALRVPWRLALDERWHDSPDAHRTLEAYSFLSRQWQQHGRLAAIYDHAGHAQASYESLALYGGTLGYFVMIQPAQGSSIVAQKIWPLYDTGTRQLRHPLSYYDNNWVWFGLALQSGSLSNYAAGVRS